MKFVLRAWRQSDVDDVAHFANHPKIAANLRNVFPYPYTKEDARQYICACLQAGEKQQYCRAIEVEGRAAGSIGVFLQDDVYCKSAELGYWLAQEYWNKGIMTAAIKQICAQAFQKYDIVRIFAQPFACNIGSRRVLENAGFTLEGILKYSVYKNGQLLDSCIYAKCELE